MVDDGHFLPSLTLVGELFDGTRTDEKKSFS
jgi:hypothetical protein